MSAWSTTRASLVDSARNSRSISTICSAAEHQLALAACRLELDEPLAEQDEQQAHVVGQRAPAHQARQWLLAVGLRPALQVGVPLGVVDDHVDADRGEMVADGRRVAAESQPGVLILLAVDDAAHQMDDRAATACSSAVLIAGSPSPCGSRARRVISPSA